MLIYLPTGKRELNASSPRIFPKEVVDQVKELDEEKKKNGKGFK